MDTDDLYATARARFDQEAARKNLREKYQAKMIFGWNGGMFRATPEMICFLNLYEDQQIVVEDLYHNPVQIKADDLCVAMRERLQEQMNAWFLEHLSIYQHK